MYGHISQFSLKCQIFLQTHETSPNSRVNIITKSPLRAKNEENFVFRQKVHLPLATHIFLKISAIFFRGFNPWLLILDCQYKPELKQKEQFLQSYRELDYMGLNRKSSRSCQFFQGFHFFNIFHLGTSFRNGTLIRMVTKGAKVTKQNSKLHLCHGYVCVKTCM